MPTPEPNRPAPRELWLYDKVALVTGGAGGIGWALARALAEHGAHVHAADLSTASLTRAGHQLAETPPSPGTITLHELDVSSPSDLDQWIADIHARHDRIDILINNAAYVRWADIADMNLAEAELTMRVGYDAMVRAINAVLPHMRARRSGHIVNVGSPVGKLFVKGPSAAYAAMKAAVEGYTCILQLELADEPVHAMLVRPTTVLGTDFFQHHVASSRLPRLADFLPTTTPDVVAQAVVSGLRRRRSQVNVPGYLPAMYLLYAFAPRLVTHLSKSFGNAQRDYTQTRLPIDRSPRTTQAQTDEQRAQADTTETPQNQPSDRTDSALVRQLWKVGSWRGLPGRLVRLLLVLLDSALHRSSHGHLSVGRSVGYPSLLLTTTGALSGQPRSVPLLHFPHRDGYTVVGSNFGQPHHPAWSTNLLRNPEAHILTEGRRIPVTARQLQGAEREEAWRTILASAQGYQTYNDRSGRTLRIFVLEPVNPLTPS
ncbi:SDR family NAD(P)-dependent oxidoreductase [Streptomyces sp. MS2.AVA.5]|uniref:SDR family NAD(P)-dependent oxidoreductase n=1 Tax=Streptomyces achmelvichensis TaxID=3134111 RepID=A0ACC6Q7Q8_9ACTN